MEPHYSQRQTPLFFKIYAALMVASPAVYFLLKSSASKKPVLPEDVFFWPYVVVATLTGIWAIKSWLFPRDPEEAATLAFIKAFIPSLFLAALVAWGSYYVYRPGLVVLNAESKGSESRAYAMVDRKGQEVFLYSPYWKEGVVYNIPGSDPAAKYRNGTLAILTVRRGLFGVTWIERIEYKEFK